MTAAKKKFIEVVTMMPGDEAIRRIEVTGKSQSQIDKIEMGLLRNMDLDRYSTRVVEE